MEVACHECDAKHAWKEPPDGGSARCGRCRATLAKRRDTGVQKTLAFTIAGLILYIPANIYAVVTFSSYGRIDATHLISGTIDLFKDDILAVATLVGLCSIVAPLVKLLALLYLTLPLSLGWRAPGSPGALRLADFISQWGMLDVYLLAVLVCFAKLGSVGHVGIGLGTWMVVGLIVASYAASLSFDPRCVLGDKPREEPIHPRSISRTWALVLAAFILYAPANLYPVMTITQLGKTEHQTILGGVRMLMAEGMWSVAILVFTASITVPLLKLIGLAFLLISVQLKWKWREYDRTRLFRVIRVIGRWSMLDLFLLSLLVALVQMGSLVQIDPGLGATAFGGVVVLTMIAAEMFDPRLIWKMARSDT